MCLVLERSGWEDRPEIHLGGSKKKDPLKCYILNGSSSHEITLHEVGLVLSFKFCWWNELINVSGSLFVDAMMDDVHFKLLPIVQVHDATE